MQLGMAVIFGDFSLQFVFLCWVTHKELGKRKEILKIKIDVLRDNKVICQGSQNHGFFRQGV